MKAKKITFFIMFCNLLYLPSSTPSVLTAVRGSFKKVDRQNTKGKFYNFCNTALDYLRNVKNKSNTNFFFR